MASFLEMAPQLPVLGVGVSLSFGVEPDPVRLAAAKGGPSFVEYAGAVQHSVLAAPMAELRRAKVPMLYHPSCLNLCGPWPNPPDWLDAVEEHLQVADSAWLAQDVSVCFVGDVPGYSINLGYFVPPILTRASLEEAVVRVLEVCARVSRPLLLEPPPVTFVVGDMDIYVWLSELVERTDCGLLLDAGHIVSHQLASGRPLTEGLDRLPLERTIELHVAGGVIEDDQHYIDAHDLPILPETWTVFDYLLRNCPHLRAVCVECEGSFAQHVVSVLHHTRQRVLLAAANTELRARVRQEMM